MHGLGRRQEFDERSRDYPVRTLLSAAPRKPKHRVWECDAYLNQGREGACVGFALAHELAAAPVVVPGVGVPLARSIYHDAQRTDQWAGGAYPGARPFYEGTSVLAGIKVLKRRGYVPEYRWAFGLADLIDAVGHLGPAVIGVNWYERMFNTDSNATITVGGRLAGGHAIMVRGVNPTMEVFVLHNSWGTSWGRYGQALISFADMERLLREDGEAAIPLTRAIKR